jgi:aerobic-type carbon monoxide dehydrogenase small subunit (CoxS/CutS family)
MSSTVKANQRVDCNLEVNGQPQTVTIEPARMLAQLLRDDLGLTGTKVACGMANCGACTVLLDGIPIYSCITLALDCQNREVTTVEGLAQNGELAPLQRAFIEQDAFQCAFCTSGQIMTLTAFLNENRNPTAEEIRQAVTGNLCRCGAYLKIVKAGLRAAEMMRGSGGDHG